MEVIAIAAIGRNRELGKNNQLLWRIPEDLKRFRELTRGHPVIMGRKTFESIVGVLGKPLPDRTNIVLTNEHSDIYKNGFHEWNAEIEAGGYISVSSITGALQVAEKYSEKIFIIGGAQIYDLFLPHTTQLDLTLIDAEDKEADTFFPPFETEFTHTVKEEAHEHEGLKYRWIELTRTP